MGRSQSTSSALFPLPGKAVACALLCVVLLGPRSEGAATFTGEGRRALAEADPVVSPLAGALRSAWARNLVSPPLSAALPRSAAFPESLPTGLSLLFPHRAFGGGAGGVRGSAIRYYPAHGIRTADGLALSQQQAFLYGVRRFELNRGQTALKGADLAGKMGLFAGAMASSFGWLSESEALWLAGGAAALGAAYGAAVGYESTAFREEWRWPKTLDEGSEGFDVQIRPR